MSGAMQDNAASLASRVRHLPCSSASFADDLSGLDRISLAAARASPTSATSFWSRFVGMAVSLAGGMTSRISCPRLTLTVPQVRMTGDFSVGTAGSETVLSSNADGSIHISMAFSWSWIRDTSFCSNRCFSPATPLSSILAAFCACPKTCLSLCTSS